MRVEQESLPLGPHVEGAAALRPGRTCLEGRHVDLVSFDVVHDGPSLFEATHGEEAERLWAYLGAGPFETFAAFEASYRAAAEKDDPLLFAIRDKSGKPLGHATYMRIDTANRVIEVGNILFAPELMHSPAGTEAMYLMARHAFETLGYRRYEWKCNALNAPSRRAAERYGFRFEGVFRHHMIVKGRNRDTAWFSMLAEEWPQIAVSMENWLAPENFDEAGHQIVPLSVFNAREMETGGHLLRRAGFDDLPWIEAFQFAAYEENRARLGAQPIPLAWDYARILREREVWLCEEEGGLAGVLVLQPRPDDVFLDSLAVSPRLRGRGLGNALLAAARARAGMLVRPHLRLMTGEALTANVDWYRRRGFAVERVEPLPDRRLVHMAMEIG